MPAHIYSDKDKTNYKKKIRAVEITCQTCLTWSHFIQDKLKISIYFALDKCKICYKVYKILYFIFLLFTCCIENTVDPDQLASSEAS